MYYYFPNFYFMSFVMKTVFPKRLQKIHKNTVLNKMTPYTETY